MFRCVFSVLLAIAMSSNALAEDARFVSPADIDHPADFKPNFPDRAAWEHRAALLRQQVLVSQGLWPMPPKEPIKATIHGAIDKGDYTVEQVFFASLPG